MRRASLLLIVCILSCTVDIPEQVVVEDKVSLACLTILRWTLPIENEDGSVLLAHEVDVLTLYVGTKGEKVVVPAHALMWQTTDIAEGTIVYATVTSVGGMESQPSNTVATSCYEGVL